MDLLKKCKEKIISVATSAKAKLTAFWGKRKGMIVKAQCAIVMSQFVTVNALAANDETIFSRAADIFSKLYGAIAGISSVTAGCVAAICLYLMFFSKNQQTVESSIQWLKRIVVCWIAIMLMATIINFLIKGLGITTPTGLSFQ